MIELLMVIVIISILGAVAVPTFLDFRKEARIASLKNTLAAIRTGINNQMMQAKLRCSNPYGYWGMPENAIKMNDVTKAYAWDDPDGEYVFCLESELPNPQDRKIFDINGVKAIFSEDGVISTDLSDAAAFSELPRNIFIEDEDFVYVFPLWSHPLVDIDGDVCAYLDLSYGGAVAFHWFYDTSSGQIYPGTNTPGINECSF